MLVASRVSIFFSSISSAFFTFLNSSSSEPKMTPSLWNVFCTIVVKLTQSTVSEQACQFDLPWWKRSIQTIQKNKPSLFALFYVSCLILRAAHLKNRIVLTYRRVVCPWCRRVLRAKRVVLVRAKKTSNNFRRTQSLHVSLCPVSGNSHRPSIRGGRWVIPARGFLKCF